MFKISINKVNIFILSWGFMLLFAAILPMSNIQKIFLDEINKETPNFTGDGYISLGIVFAIFTGSIILSPVFTILISPLLSIKMGAICSVFLPAIFFWPEKILLYTASAIQGLGLTLLWNGSGRYISENSNFLTISRNSGIFWGTFQLSLIIGHLFVYFIITGNNFNKETRKTIFVTLTTLAVIGCGSLTLLRKPLKTETTDGDNKPDGNRKSNDRLLYSVGLSMKNALNLVLTPNMMLLSITFLYTGLTLTLCTGAYTSSVGFTVKMGESRQKLVALTGIAVGVGEVIGGILSGFFARKIKIISRSTIIGFGFCVHIMCYTIILFNFPNNAPFEETAENGFITPSPILAIIGGIFLGFGDACFNSQSINIIGALYIEEVTAAIAFYNLCQTSMATIGFVYSNYVGLQVQLIILVVFGIFGTACFIMVDVKTKKRVNITTTENNAHENQTELQRVKTSQFKIFKNNF